MPMLPGSSFDSPTPEIGLLLYPRSHASMVDGMTDLLEVASAFSLARGGRPLRISHWRMLDDGAFIRCHDTHPEVAGRPQVVIAPASTPGPTPRPIENEEAVPFAAWMREQHSEGAMLASIGCGAFILAATGLLSGRRVTTHWSIAERLQASFPDVVVDADRILIEDGEILTASGMMAWTDVGMRLIDRLLGPSVMIEASQFWLIDPAGREQRHYSTFSPRLDHGDEAILKLQHKLQVYGTRPMAVSEMAGETNLEPRTFLRRFKAATGMRPTEYVQHLRIGKARELLQFTKQPVDQVARKSGYGDTAAFRGIFRRIVGLTPGDYRRRFSVNSRDKIAA